MRYPKAQKAATHEKIISAAARSFREHGSDGSGIGGVMKELGLTKGGFYRHFESKGDLYAKAVARAFDEMANKIVSVANAAPKGQELRAIIEFYLGSEHVNSPGAGCAVASLAPEMSRQPLAVRKRINQSLQAYRDRIVPFIPGRNENEKRDRFVVLFAGMAGIVAIARAVVDPERREQVLSAARSFHLKAFTSEKTV